MLHAFGPAQITDVNQAVNALFNLNECAEISEVAHASLDTCANRIFLDQRITGSRPVAAFRAKYGAQSGLHSAPRTPPGRSRQPASMGASLALTTSSR